jgi:transposase
MYDVLDLYELPYDPLLPVVCLDEKSVELHDDKRPPIRRRSGIRRDHEYVRRGTANIFMVTEPKGGRHYVRVTQRRTREDFARCLKWLSAQYPDALTIHLVMDNLNTHTEKSLVETFGPVEGCRLWSRFTIHYTPKHASWLNQAEIAICVMSRCCLGRNRIGHINRLRQLTVSFWKKRRRARWTINWRFTTKKAKEWVRFFVSEH